MMSFLVAAMIRFSFRLNFTVWGEFSLADCAAVKNCPPRIFSFRFGAINA